MIFVCLSAVPGSIWGPLAESLSADSNNRLLLCDKAADIEFYFGDAKLVYASQDFIDPYFLVCLCCMSDTFV